MTKSNVFLALCMVVLCACEVSSGQQTHSQQSDVSDASVNFTGCTNNNECSNAKTMCEFQISDLQVTGQCVYGCTSTLIVESEYYVHGKLIQEIRRVGDTCQRFGEDLYCNNNMTNEVGSCQPLNVHYEDVITADHFVSDVQPEDDSTNSYDVGPRLDIVEVNDLFIDSTVYDVSVADTSILECEDDAILNVDSSVEISEPDVLLEDVDDVDPIIEIVCCFDNPTHVLAQYSWSEPKVDDPNFWNTAPDVPAQSNGCFVAEVDSSVVMFGIYGVFNVGMRNDFPITSGWKGSHIWVSSDWQPTVCGIAGWQAEIGPYDNEISWPFWLPEELIAFEMPVVNINSADDYQDVYIASDEGNSNSDIGPNLDILIANAVETNSDVSSDLNEQDSNIENNDTANIDTEFVNEEDSEKVEDVNLNEDVYIPTVDIPTEIEDIYLNEDATPEIANVDSTLADVEEVDPMVEIGCCYELPVVGVWGQYSWSEASVENPNAWNTAPDVVADEKGCFWAKIDITKVLFGVYGIFNAGMTNDVHTGKLIHDSNMWVTPEWEPISCSIDGVSAVIGSHDPLSGYPFWLME